MSRVKFEDRFVIVLSEFLEFAESVATELNEGGHTTLDVSLIKASIMGLNFLNKIDVVEKFSEYHKYWQLSNDKNLDFILEKLPIMFSQIDTTIVTIPIEIYLDYKKRNKSDECPVDQDTVDLIWDYCNSLIRNCCLFLHTQMCPIIKKGKIEYKKRDYYIDIPIEKYICDFKIKV